MQQGQKARLIDTKAEFPKVVRDPPEVPAEPASAPETEGTGGLAGWLGLPPLTARPAPTSAEAAADKQQRDQALGR